MSKAPVVRRKTIQERENGSDISQPAESLGNRTSLAAALAKELNQRFHCLLHSETAEGNCCFPSYILVWIGECINEW